jgi:hypothetical protein
MSDAADILEPAQVKHSIGPEDCVCLIPLQLAA